MLVLKGIWKHTVLINKVFGMKFCYPLLLLALSGYDESVGRVAFGSCNRRDLPQPLWQSIVDSKPDLWIWTGDIIYGDTEDMELLQHKYQQQKRKQGYQNLLASCRVIGIWDDHDFGLRDGGMEYSQKVDSQRLLLDFLDEPANSPRRKQLGIWATNTYGKGNQQVKVFLLDGRYHRQQPGEHNDTLGESQWAWLELELRASKAAVNLIVSGIQVIPVQHPFEKWANFPEARKRLFELIARTGTSGVIFISGDRHIAEISKLAETPAGYPYYEITSSGLSHSYISLRKEPNRYRLGNFFNKLNYGLLRIDWQAKPVKISLEIRGQNNQLALTQTISLNELKYR